MKNLGLALCTLFLALLTACTTAQPVRADGATQDVTKYTPGIAGLPPTPLAARGNTLALDAAREIRFGTDEFTHASIDVSPDGQSLVFDMMGDIYIVETAGGKARQLTGGMAFDSQPVFDPTGERILFLSDRSGAENLWTMAADGTSAHQLSLYDDNPIWVSPEWTADGTSILVSRFRPDRNAYELWQFKSAEDPIGERLTLPVEGPGHALGVEPTSGGHFLVSVSTADLDFAAPDRWHLMRFPGGEVIAPFSEQAADGSATSRFRPRLSPSGKSLAYAERRGGETWLVLLDLTTGNMSDLIQLDTDNLQASMWMDAVPRFDFIPNGSAIFVNTRGKILRIDITTKRSQVVPVSIAITQPLGKLLRYEAVEPTGPVRLRLAQTPRPIGDQYVFSSLGRLFITADDGSVPIEVDGSGRAYHPAASADGNSLVYVTWASGKGGSLRLRDLETGQERILGEDMFFSHPIFSPDESAVYVFRSPVAVRAETLMEYRQFREAEIVRIDIESGRTEVVAAGEAGGTPQFSKDGTTLFIDRPNGMYAIKLDTGTESLFVREKGPSWYFETASSDVDDLKVHPSGGWALGLIGQQLWLVKIRQIGTTIELATSPDARRVSTVGADFFGWSKDGTQMWWSIGDRLRELPLAQVDRAFERPRTRQPLSLRERAAVRERSLSVEVPRDTVTGELVIKGASVITMGPQGRIENADIHIKDGRIVEIAQAGRISAADASKLDARGLFVMPGLIDMHSHVADIRRDVLSLDSYGLAVSLAFGVTTTFDPSTLSIDMLAYQDALEAGLIVGTRLLSTGPAIPSYNDFRSREEVAWVLDRYADVYRLDNIKLYRSGNRQVRQWIAMEAAERRLTVTTEGTLSRKLGLTQIIDGFSGLEHVLPPRKLYEDTLKLFALSGTSYAQTLLITNGATPALSYYGQRHGAFDDARYLRFVPPQYRLAHAKSAEADRAVLDVQEQVASAQRFASLGGVLGMGSHGDVLGLGMHWEMQAHEEAGMSTATVLRAATLGSAIAIGRGRDLGSLEPGKLADLLILSEDPEDTVSNAVSLVCVLKEGRLFEASTLDEIWPVRREFPGSTFDETSGTKCPLRTQTIFDGIAGQTEY